MTLSLVGIALALLLTPSYRSSATISVESQQIPESLVRSTITSSANERLNYITQRVLTRTRISDIINLLDVYPDQRPSNSLVKKFREAVTIETVNANIANSRRTQTISFSLAFNSSSPQKAKAVANELVTMFLQENVRTRSARAAKTTEFLAEEGEKIRAQVTDLEKLVSEFKQKNSAMLPEVHEMNLALMSRLENEYQTVMLSIEAVRSEFKILQIQSDQYQSSVQREGPSLLTLKQRLNETLIRHTDGHPDVIRLRREIEYLGKQAQENKMDDQVLGANDSQNLSDPAFARISIQIEAAERQLEYLQKNRNALSSKLKVVEQRISGAPAVERKYIDLQRDLENLKGKYQEIKNKEIEAQISQNLEEDQKGERFSLLEAAIVPTEPEKPNRLLVLLGGLGLAIAVGVASVLGREILNPGIRSTKSFTRYLGAPPLAVIPDLSVQTESTQTLVNANRRLITLCTALLAVVVAVLAVATFLKPLRAIVESMGILGGGLL